MYASYISKFSAKFRGLKNQIEIKTSIMMSQNSQEPGNGDPNDTKTNTEESLEKEEPATIPTAISYLKLPLSWFALQASF